MTNFIFLKQDYPLMYQLGIAAGQAFVPDPNTTLYKIRKLGKALAQEICAHTGIEIESKDTQLSLLKTSNLTIIKE